jgi:hypothetical protein
MFYWHYAVVGGGSARAGASRMNVAVRTAVIAGAVLLGAGCGTPDAAPHTVQGCADYGAHAIERGVTVTTVPAACQGLGKAQLNQAVAKAVFMVAGGHHKAEWRKLAAEAAPRLAHLVSTLPPPAAAPPPSNPPGHARHGENVAMTIAALLAWLVTVASGAYLLGKGLRGGGIRRLGARTRTAIAPLVVFWHLSLALGGLLGWVIYLITSWAVFAWLSLGMLLPVAGLGMSMLTLWAPAGRTRTALAVIGHGILALTVLSLVLFAAVDAGGI